MAVILQKLGKIVVRFVLIIFLLFIMAGAFAQNGVTRIYTDYNGYWTSASTAINTVKPDNSHNLLGFVWNGVTYSTGVNNALLTSKGVSFSATTYQAFPVKNIVLAGTSSNFVGLGQLYDGVDNGGSSTPPFSIPADISRLLTDGANGLDLGICVANIPTSSSALTFTFSSLTNNSALIGDGVPDILISQVAAPDNTVDQVYFEDKNGNLVGTIVSINESTTAVPSVGNWTADFYNPVSGVIVSGFIKTDRPIRIWAADASLFGLTASNYKNAVVLRYKLGGSSDPAFLAFNTAFIQLVSANDDIAVTDVGVPVSISVVTNDEPKGGLNVSSLTVTSAPTHGTVTVNTTTGVASYSPSAGFSGIDTFKYQICNSAGQCDDALVTITIGSADLAVTKTVSTTNPAKGNTVDFVIRAINNGPNDATGVVVRDVLPSGYTFVSASTNQYSSNTGNWTIGALANAANTSLTITATVNESGTYSNTAIISGTKQDLIENNNTAIATTTPVSVSDRAVTKVVSTTAPAVGSVVSFTVTATNIGPSATTTVRVNDLLASGYSFQSAIASMGTYTSSTGIWTVGSLGKSGTATLVISATVNASGIYSNTASISGTETDPVTSNNTATVTPVPVPQTDLSVIKTVNKSTPDVNTNVVFKVVASNNGPSGATNVSVTDALPSGYTLVSAVTSTGTYSAASGAWTIGSLTNGQSATLTITATVKASSTYSNTATIRGEQADPISANNSSIVTPIPVQKADLSVAKTVDKSTPTVGSNVIFTIVATNNGPSTATGVSVTDALPSGYTLVSAVTSAGSYSTSSGSWTIGDLTNGQSATLTITAMVNASGTYSNTATINGTEADPVSDNNSSIVTPLPEAQADLSIAKTLDNSSLNAGNAVFTITVINNGPSMGTDVSVTDILPNGYTYVSSTASAGSFSATTGTWQIGTLPLSSTATLTLSTSLNASGTYSNTATVSGSETDPILVNNSAVAVPAPLPPTTTQSTQHFCETAKPVISDLQAIGSAIKWYTTFTGGVALDNTSVLVTNTIYYASQTIVGYESADRLAVTAVLSPVASAGPDQMLPSSEFSMAADPGTGTWKVVSVMPSNLTSGVIITNPALYNTTVTVPNTATAILSWTAEGSSCSDEVTLVNTTPNVPDLTPIIYARPSVQYGKTDFNVVVDVVELKSIPTSGLITVMLTRDSMVKLTFVQNETTVSGRSVQNSVWTFDDSDDEFYVLTTTHVIAGGNKLSFGLSGVMNPNNTSGTFTISTSIAGGSGGEVKTTNNLDADKIDYFQQ